MNWKAYGIVTAAVVIVGLALGVTLPLVSLRLHEWGYSTFAIGVMAGMPAVGIVLGAKLTGRLAGQLGSENALRLVMALQCGLCRAAGGLAELCGLAVVAPGAGYLIDRHLRDRRKLDQSIGSRSSAWTAGCGIRQRVRA